MKIAGQEFLRPRPPGSQFYSTKEDSSAIQEDVINGKIVFFRVEKLYFSAALKAKFQISFRGRLWQKI